MLMLVCVRSNNNNNIFFVQNSFVSLQRNDTLTLFLNVDENSSMFQQQQHVVHTFLKNFSLF